MDTNDQVSARQACKVNKAPFAGITYQVVPHGALSCPGVSDGAARLFGILATERPFCTMVPGLAIARREDLARRLGVEVRAVQYRLAELVKAGYIERDQASAALWIKGVGNPRPRVQFACTRGFVGVLRTLRRTPFVRRTIERVESYIKQWAPHLLKSFQTMYSRAVGLAIGQVHAFFGGLNKKNPSTQGVHGSQAVGTGRPARFARVLDEFATVVKSGFAERRGETQSAPPGGGERAKVADMGKQQTWAQRAAIEAARARESLAKSRKLIEQRQAEKSDEHLREVGAEHLKELHELFPELWKGHGKAER